MGVFVSIEAGGTKFICSYGVSPDQLQDRVRIETRGPRETMNDVLDYVHKVSLDNEIDAIGLACFGPLELNLKSPAYGSITHSKACLEAL